MQRSNNSVLAGYSEMFSRFEFQTQPVLSEFIVKQEQPSGCVMGCLASVMKVSYREAVREMCKAFPGFETREPPRTVPWANPNHTSGPGMIVKVLKKKGYKTQVITDLESNVHTEQPIIFVTKNYIGENSSSHCLVLLKGYMHDPSSGFKYPILDSQFEFRLKMFREHRKEDALKVWLK